MAYIIKIHEPDGSTAHMVVFESTPIRIGRNQLNELVLDEPFVSYFHGILQFDEGVATYMDLGSTNGSTVNGRAAKGHTAVPLEGKMRDSIEIGPLKLSVSQGEVPGLLLSQRGGDGSSSACSLSELRGARGANAEDARLHKTQLLMADEKQSSVDEAVLEGFVAAIRPAYDASREASAALARAAMEALEVLDAEARGPAAQHALHALTALASEPELIAALKQAEVDLGARAPVRPLEWLAALTGVEDLEVGEQAAMARVGAVLETFSSALVELRRGYEQFGADMGVTVVHEDTPLHQAADARDVLRFVLDPAEDGPARVRALREIFVDLAVHQVALLSGTVAGVRDLLDGMSPAKLSGQALARPSGLFARLLPFRDAGLYRRFIALHSALVEEDRFTRTVFGRAFARAYFSVTGGSGSASGGAKR